MTLHCDSLKFIVLLTLLIFPYIIIDLLHKNRTIKKSIKDNNKLNIKENFKINFKDIYKNNFKHKTNFGKKLLGPKTLSELK